jgi:hypothetical protein
MPVEDVLIKSRYIMCTKIDAVKNSSAQQQEASKI